MTKQIVTCQTADEAVAALHQGNAALLVQRCGLCGQRTGEEIHSMIDMRFRPLAEEDAAAANARAERAEQDLARLQAQFSTSVSITIPAFLAGQIMEYLDFMEGRGYSSVRAARSELAAIISAQSQQEHADER